MDWPLASNAYPMKPYDATYGRTSVNGTSSYRVCSDGKGCLRIENDSPGMGRKQVTIINFSKNEMFFLLTKQKMAMCMNVQPGSTPASSLDEKDIKTLGGKALGEKIIDGHPCHGWRYTANNPSGNIDVETWMGDDTGCRVQSESRGPQGLETEHLISFSATTPSREAYQIPEGYTVTRPGVFNGVRSAQRSQ